MRDIYTTPAIHSLGGFTTQTGEFIGPHTEAIPAARGPLQGVVMMGACFDDSAPATNSESIQTTNTI